MKKYLIIYVLLTFTIISAQYSLCFAEIGTTNQEEGWYGVNVGDLEREGDFFTWTIEHKEVKSIVVTWGEDIKETPSIVEEVKLGEEFTLEVKKEGLLSIFLNCDPSKPELLMLNLPNIDLDTIGIVIKYIDGKYIITNKDIEKPDMTFYIRSEQQERIDKILSDIRKKNGDFIFIFENIEVPLKIKD